MRVVDLFCGCGGLSLGFVGGFAQDFVVKNHYGVCGDEHLVGIDEVGVRIGFDAGEIGRHLVGGYIVRVAFIHVAGLSNGEGRRYHA